MSCSIVNPNVYMNVQIDILINVCLREGFKEKIYWNFPRKASRSDFPLRKKHTKKHGLKTLDFF